MIAYVYCFNSKVIHLLLGNKICVHLATYAMSIYLTHQSITLSLLRPHIYHNAILVIFSIVTGMLFWKEYLVIMKIYPQIKKSNDGKAK